jgi:hypothetical protein
MIKNTIAGVVVFVLTYGVMMLQEALAAVMPGHVT